MRNPPLLVSSRFASAVSFINKILRDLLCTVAVHEGWRLHTRNTVLLIRVNREQGELQAARGKVVLGAENHFVCHSIEERSQKPVFVTRNKNGRLELSEEHAFFTSVYAEQKYSSIRYFCFLSCELNKEENLNTTIKKKRVCFTLHFSSFL